MIFFAKFQSIRPCQFTSTPTFVNSNGNDSLIRTHELYGSDRPHFDITVKRIKNKPDLHISHNNYASWWLMLIRQSLPTMQIWLMAKLVFRSIFFFIIWRQTINNFWLNTAKNRNLEKQKTQARAGKIIATALYRYPRTQCQKHNIAQDRLPSDLLFCSLFYAILLTFLQSYYKKVRQQLLDAYWSVVRDGLSCTQAAEERIIATTEVTLQDFDSEQDSAKNFQSSGVKRSKKYGSENKCCHQSNLHYS